MNKLILFLIFCFFSLGLQAQEEEVNITVPGGNVYGTLLLPENRTSIPVVLLIAGSGPTDRDGNNPMMKNNSLKMLAEALQANGIASLRYDKRGIAASHNNIAEKDIRFNDFVEDAKTWIDFLKKDTRFHSILIAGHSEGSLIGILAAQENPAVRKFISLEGAGLPMATVLRKQLASQPTQIQEMCHPILEKLQKGDTVGNVSPLLYSLFRPSVQPYLISFFKYDPAQEMARLTIPSLIVQGTYDIQTSLEDAEALAKANPKAEKVTIPKMTHLLKDADSEDKIAQLSTVYSQPDLPLNTTLVETIVRFIKE